VWCLRLGGSEAVLTCSSGPRRGPTHNYSDIGKSGLMQTPSTPCRSALSPRSTPLGLVPLTAKRSNRAGKSGDIVENVLAGKTMTVYAKGKRRALASRPSTPSGLPHRFPPPTRSGFLSWGDIRISAIDLERHGGSATGGAPKRDSRVVLVNVKPAVCPDSGPLGTMMNGELLHRNPGKGTMALQERRGQWG